MQKAIDPEHLYLARREPAADRQPVRRLRCHHLPGAAAVPALQRRRDERLVVAAPRQPWSPGPPRASRPELPTPVPPASDFVPFGVGLVQLGDVIRVEGRLTENDPAKLQFGQEVELTMVPFTTDADGNEIVTFAFQPV